MARRVEVEIVGDSRKLERSFARSANSAKKFERSVAHAGRGIASGTGLFRNFARSLAFASGGFVAFESATAFLRDSVDAAREAGVAQRSLAAQMKASGEAFAVHKEEIDRLAVSYAKFGFQNDEVVKSLTILERGTGNINKAMQLQQLTADIARAKNIELAAAANTVAKVFGGQETALRRAVPGLEKDAHGWDLIREAQQKVAGQAAANTTAAERFHAALHDTEEIVGQALLPTLNKYLDSLTKWLSNTENQKRLAADVRQVLDALATVIDGVRFAMKQLNDITGSTKHTVELLLGVFVAYKTAKIAGYLADVATQMGNIKKNTPRGGFGGGGGRAGRAAGWIAAASAVLAAGTFSAKKTVDAFYKLIGQDAKPEGRKAGRDYADTFTKEMEAFLRPNRPRLGAAAAGAAAAGAFAGRQAGTLKPPPFDEQLARRLDRLQDLTLRKQLVGLRQLERVVRARIAEARTVRGRLKLEDQLVEILREEKNVQGEITDNAKAQAQAAKDRAKAAREAAKAAAEAAAALRSERQQRFLDTGRARVPTVAHLRQELEAVRKMSGLDKDARQKLARIAKVLAGAFGKVGTDVREAIQGMFDEIVNGFDSGTTRVAKVAQTNTTKLLAGLGLTGAQRLALEGRLAGVTRRGGRATGTTAFAATHGTVITGNMYFYGVQDMRQFEDELAKRHKTRSATRRGR